MRIAEIQIRAVNSKFRTRPRVRAIVRDLTDGTSTPTEWVDASWTGGMGVSARKEWAVLTRQVISLPLASGIHEYVLEVEVSDSDLAASASGIICLRH